MQFPPEKVRFFKVLISGLACSLIPSLYVLVAFQYRPPPEALVFHSDPAYFYLMNTLLVATGDFAYCYPHPGATLQFFGGLLVFLKSILAPESSSPLPTEVFQHSTSYVFFLGTSLIVFNFLSLVAMAGVLARRGLSIGYIFCTQLLIFISPHLFSFNGIFQPEAAHMGMAAILISILNSRSAKLRNIEYFFLAGIIATKLNYLSYLLAVFVNKNWKCRFTGLLKTIVFFFIYCLVLLPTFKYFPTFFPTVFSKQEDYLNGELGWLPWSIVYTRMKDHHWDLDSGLLTTIAFVIITLLGVLVFKFKSRPRAVRVFWISVGVLVGVCVLLIKKPTHYYYAFPALVTLPLTYTSIILMVRSKAFKIILTISVLFFLAFKAEKYHQHLKMVALENQINLKNAFYDVKETSEKYPSCIFLSFASTPRVEEAIIFGAGWAGMKWHPTLAEIYPKWHTIAGDGRIINAKNDFIDQDAWIKSKPAPCVLVAFPNGVSKEYLDRFEVLKGSKLEKQSERYSYYLKKL